MALDRELSALHDQALRHHLRGCEDCRSRLSALEAAANETVRLTRQDTAGHDVAITVLRARIQQRMSELRSECDRSTLFRLARLSGSVPLFARVGMAAALLVLLGWFVRLDDAGVPGSSVRAQSLPDERLTPGATANISVADLCSGAAPARTIVPMPVRQQVLQQYRMEHVPPSEYELDYLITPELGGIGDPRNLWPERYDSGPWNAHIKDDLERLLSRLVCDGSIDLAVAQREIAANWIDAYKKHFGTNRPIPRHARINDGEIRLAEAALPLPTARRAAWRVAMVLTTPAQRN
jgi:hypothetical protein